MNNEHKNKSNEALPLDIKRARRKRLYTILSAGLLLVILIIAVVLLVRPSRTERFRQNLLEAIKENDRQLYLETIDYLSFNGNERMYDFRNKEEQLAIQEAQRRILHIWLDEEKTLWDDEELEKRTVVGEIYLSGSYGSGLAESDEGFALVKKAIKKLEKKHSLGPNQKRIIDRLKNGQVAVGIRSHSHRTRP